MLIIKLNCLTDRDLRISPLLFQIITPQYLILNFPNFVLMKYRNFLYYQAKDVLEWLSNISQPAVDRTYLFDSIPDMVFVVMFFISFINLLTHWAHFSHKISDFTSKGKMFKGGNSVSIRWTGLRIERVRVQSLAGVIASRFFLLFSFFLMMI